VPLCVQKLFPGPLTAAWNREMENFAACNIVARLWEQDASLWPAEQHEVASIKSNLRWLNLPEQIAAYVSQVMDAAVAAKNEGLDKLVFVGMGGSNLACATVLDLLEPSARKHIHLLDTMDPHTLQKLESKLNFERVLFVFASKSGKRIETHALLLYFLDKLKSAGIESPGKHFVAFTDEGSYLATLATPYKFRDVFFDPPGILARYSGLIHFSIFLAVVGQVDKSTLLATIFAMRDACGPATQIIENPAAALAAFLAAGEREGLNRLIILAGDHLLHFAYRIAQLVGTSTSGNGRGLVPIFMQQPCSLDTVQRECLAVTLTVKGHTPDRACLSEHLRNTGVPLIEIELESLSDLAAEIFKWELATALACVPLGINCFQDDHARSNLALVAEQLDEIAKKRCSVPTGARVSDDGIDLYANGETRRLISSLTLRNALETFLALRNKNSYVAICPFFELTPDRIDVLRRMRGRMCAALGLPVQISSGPRYLYTLGKAYKEGPPNGIFMIVTAEPKEDVAIPGAGYTFGELQMAFALAEFGALEVARKHAIRLHLTPGSEKGLKQLSDVVIQALP
jgi:transaldolase / glucose-6-phosphate isomerase